MDKFILSPGPTQCKKEFLNTLGKPVLYHRCLDFHNLYSKLRSNLANIYNLEGGQVVVLASSGTGAMEASVQNFFSANDHVLVISIGHFGNRFAEICKSYNLKCDVLSYPLGRTYDYNQVKDYIKNNSDLKGVFVTHHETSSGVLNKLEPIGKLVSNIDDCLFVVDSISGLLAHPMEMTKWNIDCCLSASQKGFCIPPGVAVVALSNKALSKLDRGNCPRYYFDFRKYISNFKIEETPFTPNISLMLALNKSCDYLLKNYGLENYIQHHIKLRKYLEDKLQVRNFDINFISEEDKGNVLVAVKVKPQWDARLIHDKLDEKGYIVATGFGDLKPKMLRIGIIGDVHKENIDKFIICLDETIKELYG